MSKRVTEDNVVDAAGGSRPADVGGPRVSPSESPCVSKGMTEDNAADSMSDHILPAAAVAGAVPNWDIVCSKLLKAAYLPRAPTECTDTAAAEPQYEETDSHYNDSDNEDEGRTQRQPLAAAPHPEASASAERFRNSEEAECPAIGQPKGRVFQPAEAIQKRATTGATTRATTQPAHQRRGHTVSGGMKLEATVSGGMKPEATVSRGGGMKLAATLQPWSQRQA